MPKWKVRVEGAARDLDALAGLGVVSGEEGVFFLRLPDLDNVTDGSVLLHARDRLEVLKGLARLCVPHLGDVHVVEGAIGEEADGTLFVIPARAVAFFVAHPVLAIDPITGETIHTQVPPHSGWAVLAQRDPNVRLALRYFGPEPTAGSLWKVYEVIRDDVGGGDKSRGKALIESRGWATPAELDGFRSVHYPSVLRDEARHGIEPTRQAAPVAPMSLAEARRFITRLLKDWLGSK